MVFNSYPQKGYEEGPAELGMAWTEDENLLDWHFPDKPFYPGKMEQNGSAADSISHA